MTKPRKITIHPTGPVLGPTYVARLDGDVGVLALGLTREAVMLECYRVFYYVDLT